MMKIPDMQAKFIWNFFFQDKKLANSGFSCTIREMTEEGANGPLF